VAWGNGPQVGELMPPFHLPDEAGRIVSLDELLTKGPVAVVPPWTLVSLLPTEYQALAQAQKEMG
jgi:hypothetical protein